jgi:hypothetical protein
MSGPKDFKLTFSAPTYKGIGPINLDILITVDVSSGSVSKMKILGDDLGSLSERNFLYDISNGVEVPSLAYQDPLDSTIIHKVYTMVDGDTTSPGVLFDNVFNTSIGGGVSKYGIALDLRLFDAYVICVMSSVTDNFTTTPIGTAFWLNTKANRLVVNNTSPMVWIPYTVSCFGEYTQISTVNGYKRIQDLVPGTLIETFLDGYKPLKCVGKRQLLFMPRETYIDRRMYVLPNSGLQITGKHCLLVDELTEKQRIDIMKLSGKIQQLDGMYLLPVGLHSKAIPLDIYGKHNIYHIVLEDEMPDKQYGIFANEVLVESCSYNDFVAYSSMNIEDDSDDTIDTEDTDDTDMYD